MDFDHLIFFLLYEYIKYVSKLFFTLQMLLFQLLVGTDMKKPTKFLTQSNYLTMWFILPNSYESGRFAFAPVTLGLGAGLVVELKFSFLLYNL